MKAEQTNSLQQLKQFLQNLSLSSRPDTYWQSILQSDIRNIIPKYEVAKIQLVKTNLSKVRLILQNINAFISLQMQKKHLKQETIDLNQNVSAQLLEIIHQNKINESKYHYDTNLSARKKQVQLLFKQLTKNRTLPQLKSLVVSNKKWTDYIEKNVKVLEKVKQEQLHEEIINFIQTYEGLFNISSDSTQLSLNEPSSETVQQIILKSGSYTKIYQNKLCDKILIKKLVEDIYSQSQTEKQTDHTTKNNDEDDYWSKKIKKLRKIHNL